MNQPKPHHTTIIDEKALDIVISIGCTTLKIAYKTATGNIVALPLQEGYRDESVPTVLLQKRCEETGRIEVEIGQKAQDEFHSDMPVNAVFIKLTRENFMVHDSNYSSYDIIYSFPIIESS